ncbi:MAG: Eco57I restriction-modification methylase domain-containing protein [Candidatus Loosdrechtia sp.]|uniref:Eco57I restriction-modification methylase domain-containing protein n=1 Tax=Candidatus Loosdrechtia sp. TaxID=3101272 RepID=UPI00403B0EB0
MKNQKLFSNNYLEHRLQSTSLWNADNEKVRTAFENIKDAYRSTRSLKLGPGEEANLEDKFIRPVLTSLDYEWDVQPTTQRGAKKKRPDYALFKDNDSYKEARKEKDNFRYFYSYSLTILEAKYWGRSLNDTDPKDILDTRDPTAQIVKYLDDVYYASQSRIQWAILTNGKVWRLFYYRAASRSGNYYEVDLEEIINCNNPDTFKYFYLFFSKDAFISDPVTGKTWLDQHIKGSEDYAARVSENLKNLIFDKIFEGLAEGFIEYRCNEKHIKKETDEDLKEIFNGCLTLLYRLLFLLYAESRALLPVNDQDRYYKKSLKRLKEDIANELEITIFEGMSHQTYDYWSRLESLCRIIERGDKALNIPVYNGGLFETPLESFLAANKISDPYLAEAIALLTIDQQGEYTPGQKPFIDYSSLDVRHLGNIYEGLLEFHIRIADEPMVEIKEGSKLLWKKESEIDATTRIYRRKEKGGIYIENSKHERKATGSYYTPHYIVEYIVKNTVGPVLETRFQRAHEILSELEALYRKQQRQLKKLKDWKYWEHLGEPLGTHIDEIQKLEEGLFETVFDVKVLDPAMGSGHFLVHTVDFITDKVIAFLANFPENPVIRKMENLKHEILEGIKRQGVSIDESKLTEVNLTKRTVMKRCIYGVDLNAMAVELTKLSLWLDSFTLGAPLSFLDHHLKCGNSLIGSNLETLRNATEKKLFRISLEPLNRAIRNMLFVSSLSDATYQQVKDSERKYRDADKSIIGYRILLDILVSEHFGVKEAKIFLPEVSSIIDLDNLKRSIDSLHKKDRKTISSIERIAKGKRFFHWEIEFPEVFFERVGSREQKVERKENPGFDCVIGNPPYIGFHGFEEIKFYLKQTYQSCSGKYDIYIPFIELFLRILRKHGKGSYICPSGFMKRDYGKHLRILLNHNAMLEILHDFRDYQVFEGATNYTCIFVFSNNPVFSNYNFKASFGNDLHSQKFTINTEYTLSEEAWNITTDNLLMKVKSSGRTIPLKEIASVIAEGIVTGCNDVFVLKNNSFDNSILAENGVIRKALKGETTDRYEIKWDDTYLIYPYKLDVNKTIPLSEGELKKYPNTYQYLLDKRSKLLGRDYFDNSSKFWFELWNQRDLARQSSRKIVVQENSAKNEFVIANGDYFYLDTCCGITIKAESNLSDLYILALLNSNLLDFIFKQITVPKAGGHYIHKPMFLERLPIARIFFTTPNEERKKEVKDAISFYNNQDKVNIQKWIDRELKEKRNDTIHDLLAYLAEEMIKMNEKKNREIKGFLKWLEREIGSEIDDLSNKTAIKEYHEHSYNQLIEILKRNRSKLSIDPSDRKTQEKLEDQFTQSISILEPLKTKIKATDDLIDEIVYKLYGLTEEEIKIVKGEVSA